VIIFLFLCPVLLFSLSCQNYELLMFWLNKNTSHFFNQGYRKLDSSYEIPDRSFITVTQERQYFFSTFFNFLTFIPESNSFFVILFYPGN